MHLARIAKGRGFSLQVILQKDLYVTRMYTSLGQIWRGWSRIFYGCLGTLRRLAAAMTLLTVFSLMPWASLVASVIGWACAGPETVTWWRPVAALAAVTTMLEQSVMARFYRLVRAGPVWSIGYILAACICWGMLASAMLKRLGATGTTWRGTRYRGSRLEPGQLAGPDACPPAPPAEDLGTHAP
jgi:hypothetical protein